MLKDSPLAFMCIPHTCACCTEASRAFLWLTCDITTVLKFSIPVGFSIDITASLLLNENLPILTSSNSCMANGISFGISLKSSSYTSGHYFLTLLPRASGGRKLQSLCRPDISKLYDIVSHHQKLIRMCQHQSKLAISYQWFLFKLLVIFVLEYPDRQISS